MLVAVSPAEFPAFKLRKQRFDKAYLSLAMDLFRAITGAEGAEFCPFKRTIMAFLLNVTYASGRQAAQVYAYQFESGMRRKGEETLICAGLNMSRPSYRKHLKELSAEGFITIYTAKMGEEGHETDARIFEIDCKKLLNRGATNDQGGGKETYPHHRGNKEIAKAIFPGDAGTVVNEVEAGGNVIMLKQPKKGYWKPAQTDEAPAQVIQRIQQAAAIRTATVKASASTKLAHELDKAEMQSLIDPLMRMYQPGTPRMLVTQKEFGFFRKRLKEQPPGDFLKFLSWALRYWGEVASQSQRAIKRREEAGNRTTGTAMDKAPSFAALVYRYPYLLKAYANFDAARRDAPNTDAEEGRRVKALEAEVSRLVNNERTLKKALATSKVQAAPPTRARLARTARPMREEEDLPEWDDAGENNAKRA